MSSDTPTDYAVLARHFLFDFCPGGDAWATAEEELQRMEKELRELVQRELRAEIARREKEHAAPSGAGQNAGEDQQELPAVTSARLARREQVATQADEPTGCPVGADVQTPAAQSGDSAQYPASPAPVPEGMVMVPKHILRDAIEQCPCTLRERDSGHRIGCIAPVLQDLLAAAPKPEDKP